MKMGSKLASVVRDANYLRLEEKGRINKGDYRVNEVMNGINVARFVV